MSKEKASAAPQDPLPRTSWLDPAGWEEFLTRHGNTLMWSTLGVAVLLLALYFFSSNRQTASQNDYFDAQREFNALQQSYTDEKAAPDSGKKALNALAQILQRRPELHSKYDGILAQFLLIEGNVAAALPYANADLARTLNNAINPSLATHGSYANTSLLISQKQYADSLQQALALKERLKTEQAQYTEQPRVNSQVLNMFNLLRIAVLYQQLEQPKEEWNAWQELKKEGGWNGTLPADPTALTPAFILLVSHLQEGRISLLNYIDMREKVLAPHGT